MKDVKRFRVMLVGSRSDVTVIDGECVYDVACRVQSFALDHRRFGRRIVSAGLFERIVGVDCVPRGWVRRDFESLWSPWLEPRS